MREGRSKQIYELKQSQDAENFGRKLNAAEANETDDEQQFHVLVKIKLFRDILKLFFAFFAFILKLSISTKTFTKFKKLPYFCRIF